MTEKITFGGDEYPVDTLSDRARQLMSTLKLVEKNLSDRKNMLAVLTRAKQSYMDEIRGEIISAKAGFDFTD